MEKIRYAVVGINHGKSHVMFAMDSDQVELAAICDNNPTTLNDVSKLTSDVRQFTDYDEMIAWGEFDAVVISVPPFLHKDFSIKALQADKHVFVEKPLTGELQTARELRDLVKTSEKVFQVGYCVRSSQLIQRILSIIDDGSMGKIVNVWWNMFLKSKGQMDWRKERLGGKLFDCCCHYLDIMQMVAGAPFYRLSAFGHELGKTGLNPDLNPEVASVLIEYQNGAKGTLNLSEVTPSREASHFGVVGTKGIIYGDPWQPEGAGSLKCCLNDGLYLDTLAINGEIASRGHLGFKEQHYAFIDAISTGKGNPCTIDDGFEVELIMDAIDRSLSTGQTILRETVETG